MNESANEQNLDETNKNRYAHQIINIDVFNLRLKLNTIDGYRIGITDAETSVTAAAAAAKHAAKFHLTVYRIEFIAAEHV